MQKPNGYDEAQASGEFVPVKIGGHRAVVKQVSETTSRNGQPMIVVLFDFDNTDAQTGYFSEQFNNDDRPEKKWPFAGSKYIMVNDYQDKNKTSKNFKTFCTCIEKSNGCKIAWGSDNWAGQFKGKKIGVVFGEEESEYDGKITMKHLPRWFCSYDSALTANIPAAKLLKRQEPGLIATASDGFMNIPKDADAEIPF